MNKQAAWDTQAEFKRDVRDWKQECDFSDVLIAEEMANMVRMFFFLHFIWDLCQRYIDI